jgi:hypothetical protein
MASRPIALASWRITCNGCSARYANEDWLGLHLSERLSPNEVGRLIVDWSDDECIEVRRCRRCSRLLAAKRPVRPSSDEC